MRKDSETPGMKRRDPCERLRTGDCFQTSSECPIGLSRTLCMLKFKGIFFKMPRDISSTWPWGSHRSRIPMNVTNHHQDFNPAVPSGAPHPLPAPGPTQHQHKSVDPTSGRFATCWICWLHLATFPSRNSEAAEDSRGNKLRPARSTTPRRSSGCHPKGYKEEKPRLWQLRTETTKPFWCLNIKIFQASSF